MSYLRDFINSNGSSFIKKIGKTQDLNLSKEEAWDKRQEIKISSLTIMREFRHWERFKYDEIKLYFLGCFIFEKKFDGEYWDFGENFPSIGFFHLLTIFQEFQYEEEQKEVRYFIWKNLYNNLSPFGRYHSYKALDANSLDAMEDDWNSILQRCKVNIERRANR